MTDPPLVAQAVLDAFWGDKEYIADSGDINKHIAAALRAAADQAVPGIGREVNCLDKPVEAELQNVRSQLLAIAAELASYGHQPAPPAAGDCPACEGVLKPGNQPCAVCGRSALSAEGEVAELAWWLRSLEDASVWFESGSPTIPNHPLFWQPIDIAPKDGTEILASDYDAIDIVSWIEPRFNLIPGEWINREGKAMYPAWWQPLPDHPPLPEE